MEYYRIGRLPKPPVLRGGICLPGMKNWFYLITSPTTGTELQDVTVVMVNPLQPHQDGLPIQLQEPWATIRPVTTGPVFRLSRAVTVMGVLEALAALPTSGRLRSTMHQVPGAGC